MRAILKVIKRRRTIRKFSQGAVALRYIEEAIDAARFAPSAGNLQFLEYLLIRDKRTLPKIFDCLMWAAYIYPQGNPKDNERPTSYIIVLSNKKKSSSPDERDVGAAVENILLALESRGVATCWLASCRRERIRRVLKLPPFLEIDSVIALGFPKQKSRVTPFKGSIKYYLDSRGNLCVPKRKIKDILFVERYR